MIKNLTFYDLFKVIALTLNCNCSNPSSTVKFVYKVLLLCKKPVKGETFFPLQNPNGMDEYKKKKRVNAGDV